MANVRSYHVKGNRERKQKKRKRSVRLAKFIGMGEAAMERFADRMAMKGKQ